MAEAAHEGDGDVVWDMKSRIAYRIDAELLAGEKDLASTRLVEGRGRCAIEIVFADQAADRLLARTAKREGATLVVLVDGKIVAAPRLSTAISTLVHIEAGSCEETRALAESLKP